jgi:menaquinone-dependent protoporphyrinogen oxidase
LTRVLVAYATRFGSTHEIAAALVRELNSAGLDAQAAEATSGLKPNDYDAFVIGSPLYGRTWLAAAGVFAAITSEQIEGKQVALFSVGTLGVKNQEAGDAEHKEFIGKLAEVAPKLNIVADTVFTGYFERANLPWYLRTIDRFAPTPQGDHRDWPAIQAWAKSLAPKFLGK